eukprot:scaffold309162_cov19-Tisochrysis_lutea.AAC.2
MTLAAASSARICLPGMVGSAPQWRGTLHVQSSICVTHGMGTCQVAQGILVLLIVSTIAPTSLWFVTAYVHYCCSGVEFLRPTRFCSSCSFGFAAWALHSHFRRQVSTANCTWHQNSSKRVQKYLPAHACKLLAGVKYSCFPYLPAHVCKQAHVFKKDLPLIRTTAQNCDHLALLTLLGRLLFKAHEYSLTAPTTRTF